jgi:hypothetical protein
MINDNINMSSAIARSTNIFVMFGGHIFQQTIGIPMSTNCASLLADLFLHSYEAFFIQGFLKKKTKEASPIL